MLYNTVNDGLLKISGPDAKKLLQGQLTTDVNALVQNTSMLSALCNREGRIISLFRLFLHNDAYYLFMLKAMVPITIATLKKFAVFYKVALDDASDELPTLAKAFPLEKYADLQQKVPAIYPETSGKFLPHELRLPELNAISFDKGCFTGQEIIARMHYKGKMKKQLITTTLETTETLLPGQDLFQGGVIVDVELKSKDNYNILLLIEDGNTAWQKN